MSFVLLCVLAYLLVGAGLTFAWIKWGGLEEDAFALVVFAVWPAFLLLFGGGWIWEKTPWYKKRKWRRRLRVAVSEENEEDESFLRRCKRL